MPLERSFRAKLTSNSNSAVRKTDIHLFRRFWPQKSYSGPRRGCWKNGSPTEKIVDKCHPMLFWHIFTFCQPLHVKIYENQIDKSCSLLSIKHWLILIIVAVFCHGNFLPLGSMFCFSFVWREFIIPPTRFLSACVLAIRTYIIMRAAYSTV
jgi:hypothetical protein